MKSHGQAGSQLQLLSKEAATTRFGGGLRKGKRKQARPVSIKTSMHLTLRASKAVGKMSMLRGDRPENISKILRRFGKRYGVLIERVVNVGNHLHLLVRASSRTAFQAFLRAAAGQIAMLVTGARKGNPARGSSASGMSTGIDAQSAGDRAFWDGLAFSRVVRWGKDRAGVLRYFSKNVLESLRMIKNGRVVEYTTDLWPQFAEWMGLPP